MTLSLLIQITHLIAARVLALVLVHWCSGSRVGGVGGVDNWQVVISGTVMRVQMRQLRGWNKLVLLVLSFGFLCFLGLFLLFLAAFLRSVLFIEWRWDGLCGVVVSRARGGGGGGERRVGCIVLVC